MFIFLSFHLQDVFSATFHLPHLAPSTSCCWLNVNCRQWKMCFFNRWHNICTVERKHFELIKLIANAYRMTWWMLPNFFHFNFLLSCFVCWFCGRAGMQETNHFARSPAQSWQCNMLSGWYDDLTQMKAHNSRRECRDIYRCYWVLFVCLSKIHIWNRRWLLYDGNIGFGRANFLFMKFNRLNRNINMVMYANICAISFYL